MDSEKSPEARKSRVLEVGDTPFAALSSLRELFCCPHFCAQATHVANDGNPPLFLPLSTFAALEARALDTSYSEWTVPLLCLRRCAAAAPPLRRLLRGAPPHFVLALPIRHVHVLRVVILGVLGAVFLECYCNPSRVGISVSSVPRATLLCFPSPACTL